MAVEKIIIINDSKSAAEVETKPKNKTKPKQNKNLKKTKTKPSSFGWPIVATRPKNELKKDSG